MRRQGGNGYEGMSLKGLVPFFCAHNHANIGDSMGGKERGHERV